MGYLPAATLARDDDAAGFFGLEPRRKAAIDKSIQELMAVHAMEEKLSVPTDQRKVLVSAAPSQHTKKPAPPKKG